MPSRRLTLLGWVVAGLALLGAPDARAKAEPLFPGVTYERSVEFTLHGPVAIRVVRGPRPVGLYRLRTTLSNETVLGRETVSSMQRRLLGQATVVGVNGDYSRFADGKPSGILLRDGVLVTPPTSGRSSAGITLDGTLDVDRVGFRGTWRGTGERRTLRVLNDLPERNGVALFTSDWGRYTPRVRGSFAVVLSPFPASVPNVDLGAPVTATAEDGPVALAPGTAVLVGRGAGAASLRAEAPIGTNVTLRLVLRPDWSTVSDAIGGGPVLVRDGRAVIRAGEAFTVAQLAPRHPRTAIGQTADGRILMVVVDGRQPGYSIGMTTSEMALMMVRLGAVRAMQLDSGGSSTIAFDGKVLNSPSDGRERPIGTALMLEYSGVFAPPPLETVVSPNGDGVADVQRLSYKVVRPSTVTVSLTRPDGVIAARESGARNPGTYGVAFPPADGASSSERGQPASAAEAATPGEGRWTLAVTSTDDQGLSSSIVRPFVVNSTLGFLRVGRSRLLLRRKGASAPIRWTQTRAARVRVTVESPGGVVLRTLSSAIVQPGARSVTWNGRGRNGRLVRSGRYVVRVTATNELGSVSLAHPLVVRRVKR